MGSVTANSDPIQWLHNPSLTVEAVGWKAAVLSNLQSAGMAVPPGFIVSPQYFQDFLQGLSWPEDGPPSSAQELWTRAEGLQAQVDQLGVPPQWERSLRGAYECLRDRFPNTLYILRPSIGVLRPAIGFVQTTGLLESVLHSIETADEGRLWWRFCEDLRSLYRQCFQARSLLYWHYHQQSLARLPLAVLVQPLLPALAAGTIEILPQELKVSATWGMGLGLMRGESVADRYGFRGSEPVTIHLGQKSWIYWHPETPGVVNSPVQGEWHGGGNYSGLGTGPPPALRSALALQKVIPELQHQPVLSPAQLTLLREKTLALLSRFAELDSLEWIFTPSPSNPAELNLVWTQGAAGSLVAGQDPLKTPEQDDRFVTVAESPLGCLQEHQGHHQGHIQGLGVSPGVQVGQVYGLDTLQSNHHARDSAPIILVAQQLTPEIFPWLTEVHGLVLAEGGMTSHGAILARELEIPAVVGVGLANLPYLLSQSWLRVEGTAGWVEGLPADTPIAASHVGKISREVPGSEQHHINQHRIGLPPTPIRIFATINQVASLGSLPAYPVEGVGLLRSEWFGLDLWEGQHPHCWIAQGRQGELRQRLCDRLQSCIQAIQPRSLFYRSVDCRAAEFQSLRGQEVFPWTIGGAFAHCQDPRVLRLEFEILHQIDRGGSPVHLVLPMVRTVEEFIHCRDRYHQFLEEHILDPEKLAQKFPPDPFPPQHLPQEAFTPLSPEPLSLWVMVEVPSLLLQLPALAEAGVQGLVIGPGDLAHHFLGLDRERSGNLVHEVYHPLVHEVILKVLQEANQLPLPTLLCCAPETLPPEYLTDYGQAGLWGITAEIPQLRAWGL